MKEQNFVVTFSLFFLKLLFIYMRVVCVSSVSPNLSLTLCLYFRSRCFAPNIIFNLFFLRIHSCRTATFSFFQYSSNLSYYPFQTLVNMSLTKQSSKTTTAAKSTHHQQSQTAAGPTSQAWMTWQTQQMYDLIQKLLTHQPCKKTFHEQKKLQIYRQSII